MSFQEEYWQWPIYDPRMNEAFIRHRDEWAHELDSQQRRRMLEGYWVADLRREVPRPYEGMPDAVGYTLSNLFGPPIALRDYVPVIPPKTPGTTQILPLDVKTEHPMFELSPENCPLQPKLPPLPWFEFEEVGCPLLDRASLTQLERTV